VDGFSFYPKALYETSDAPLHFLQSIHDHVVAMYDDPIVKWTPETGDPGHSWVALFLVIEVLFQLPTALYALYRLGARRSGGSYGGDELLFLVYGLETSLTTLVCIHDVFYWDDVAYPPHLKQTFISIYAPWCIVREYLSLFPS
jgi:hypothetical protein